MAPQFIFLIGKSPLVIILVPFLCIIASLISVVSLPILWLKQVLLSRRLKERILRALPKVCFSSEFEAKLTDCAICLMEYEGGDILKVLPLCGHGFHVDCIDRWLKCQTSCPSCRAVVILESNETQVLGEADTAPLSDTVCPSSNPYGLIFWHQ